jgi:hypothetical protein
MSRIRSATCAGFLLAVLLATTDVRAQAWLGVVDPDGITWARVRVVNLAAEPSNWSISGGRTAVASDATTALVDAELDWDGIVAPGSGEYVWVYGKQIQDIRIANADGGSAAYLGQAAPVADGGGELVIAIAADGTSSVSVEPVAPYESPAVTGTLPE